jgi:hypothetical protein
LAIVNPLLCDVALDGNLQLAERPLGDAIALQHTATQRRLQPVCRRTLRLVFFEMLVHLDAHSASENPAHGAEFEWNFTDVNRTLELWPKFSSMLQCTLVHIIKKNLAQCYILEG